MPIEQTQQPSKPKSERRESIFESPPREFEYKDAEGKIICHVIIELSRNTEAVGYERAEVQRIKKLVLIGEKEGKQTKLDLMSFAQAIDSEIEVMVTMKHNSIESAYYNDFHHRIVLEDLARPENILTFLHELGHAAQKKEKRFANLTAADKYSRGVYSEVKTSIDIVTESMDLPLNEEQQRALQEYRELDAVFQKLYSEQYDIKAKLESYKSSSANIEQRLADINYLEARHAQIGAQIATLRDRVKKLLKPLEPLLSLPQKINERNATARALVWARQFKQLQGIDLLRPQAITAALPKFARSYADCLGAMGDMLSMLFKKTPQQAERALTGFIASTNSLNEEFFSLLQSGFKIRPSKRLTDFALGTYKADTRAIRQTYGRTPSPKETDAEVLGWQDIEDSAMTKEAAPK